MTMSQEKEVASRIADWNIANEFRLGQVQGFGYGADGLHLVIRDCWLKPNEQTVWERHATLETHATDHAEMMRQIEVYRLALALRETAALRTARDDGYRQGVGDAAAKLRLAGQRLSNTAFNLSQRDALPETDRRSLRDGYKDWDAAIAAILTLTPSSALAEPDRQGVGARVKPLVWTVDPPAYGTSRASTPFDYEYMVWEIDGIGCWTNKGMPGLLVKGGLEAAKAAAQRDYEQRIMSALAEPGDGWQPIKDAPRIAGARYLATGGGLKERVCIVEWNERIGCWNAEDGPTLDDIDDELDGYSRPSLFQPLPSPPRIPSPGDTGYSP